MGLLQPTEGAILIDGVPLDQYEKRRGWQAHIAHVPQSIFLSASTISENIAFGIPEEEVDINKVKQCAEMAQIAETIANWPKGFNTQVGERGIRLSGGQRQRIGIARALYKEVDVLILDEATSALDEHTEAEVMEAIHRLNPELTIIMVAHRLSTLERCDEILDLSAGVLNNIEI
jgi:ATP-binding cassette subfamily B protein